MKDKYRPPQRPVYVVHEDLGGGVKNCVAIKFSLEEAEQVTKFHNTPCDIQIFDSSRTLYENLSIKY